MNIFTFTDLHSDFGVLKRVVRRAKSPDIDVVVIPGDLTTFNQKLKAIFKRLNEINKPVLLIPGNHETNKSIAVNIIPYHNLINIHKKIVEIAGISFAGYGLGGFARKNNDLRVLAVPWKRKLKNKKVVLVVHGPPYGTTLDEINGNHVGNEDITYLTKELNPVLLLCGHIHENAGRQDKIGRTLLLNPGWEGMKLKI